MDQQSEKTVFVPVMDRDGKTPLMPTTPSRARRWIKSGEATPFFKKGVFCIRLNRAPSGRGTQPIAATADPGSKREGFTVKSRTHTYLNVHAEAVTWVKDAVKTRSEMRRGRRFRKTPCRKPGPAGTMMGAEKRMLPSTKARWGWKLRVFHWLSALFPVTDIGVEDIQAATRKGKRKWNVSFSPLQVGKDWFYEEIRRMGVTLHLWAGFETKGLRDRLGLKKTGRKLAETGAEEDRQETRGDVRRALRGFLGDRLGHRGWRRNSGQQGSALHPADSSASAATASFAASKGRHAAALRRYPEPRLQAWFAGASCQMGFGLCRRNLERPDQFASSRKRETVNAAGKAC